MWSSVYCLFMKYKRAFPLLLDLSSVQCKEKYEILKVKMDTSMQKKVVL